MSIFEYNEEQHMKLVREEGWEDGRQAGILLERANTERERANAEKERANAERERDNAQRERLRAEEAEREIARLLEENRKLKENSGI